MALPYYEYKEWLAWMNYWQAWVEWRNQKPSILRPIKYIKWYRSEPKYGKDN